MLRADFPFDPRRVPVFYGWVIVVVATVGTVMSVPGQTVGVGVFTDSLIEATGLDRLTVSNAYLVGTLVSGLSLPSAGRLLDRLGARPTAIAAALLLSATLVYLSQIDRIVAALGGSPILATCLLSLGFYAVRLSGQGTLTMVSRTMLGRWFDRRRGLVAGLSGVVVGFWFGWAPQVLDDWVGVATWRGAWMQMAAVEFVVMGLVAFLFFRDDPESCGLEVDGRRPKPDVATGPELAMTRGEALRTLAFWAVAFALSTQALVLTGVTFHIVDLGASSGLERSASVAIFLPLAIVSTGFGLVGGAAGDRLPVRALIVVMMAGNALGIWAVADLSTRAAWAVLGLGVSSGLFGPLSTIALPRFFGRKHLGSIVGVEMMTLVVASSLGPSLYALSRHLLGEYRPALYASLALPAAAITLALTFRPPTKGLHRPFSRTP